MSNFSFPHDWIGLLSHFPHAILYYFQCVPFLTSLFSTFVGAAYRDLLWNSHQFWTRKHRDDCRSFGYLGRTLIFPHLRFRRENRQTWRSSKIQGMKSKKSFQNTSEASLSSLRFFSLYNIISELKNTLFDWGYRTKKSIFFVHVFCIFVILKYFGTYFGKGDKRLSNLAIDE